MKPSEIRYDLHDWQAHLQHPTPKTQNPGTTRSPYRVECADPHAHGPAVRLLVERRYAWRGLLAGGSPHHPTRPNCVTLVASSGDTVFGTVSLRVESDEGLLADALYGEELAHCRRGGARLCEITRLAVDTHHNTKEVLGALFHLIYIHGRLIHGSTGAVIEVHPRHAGFYKRMLGFRILGDQKSCPRVNHAPAVLLHLDLAHMDEQIARWGGTGGSGARSLYPYFLSREEQDEILAGLAAEH